MRPDTTGKRPAREFLAGEGAKEQFRRALLRWFTAHARPLPWRPSPGLYETWISEVMLQQTQVATVIPYYVRFLQRFPDVEALAAAQEQELLRFWEGLGYYRRARQLHAAAQQILADHAGRMPTDFAAWRSLPGIGRYTAGAILSIALDQRLPILEANTVRLLARLAALEADPSSRHSQDRLWSLAESLVPPRRCGDFNQALMELGSTVCTPRRSCLSALSGGEVLCHLCVWLAGPHSGHETQDAVHGSAGSGRCDTPSERKTAAAPV